VNAATENLGFVKELIGEVIEGERKRKEPTLLLVVLLTVPIRDNVARGRLVGLMGNRKGAGCCSLILSDCIESRIPPSLLPALDIGGVIGTVADLLNFKGCGISGHGGDWDTNVEACDANHGLL
jgi:hypothetical protein